MGARRVGAGGVVILLLVASACSSDGPKGAKAPPLANIERATLAAGSARFVLSQRSAHSAAGQQSSSRLSGEVDFAHDVGAMHALGLSLAAGGGIETQTRWIGGVLYRSVNPMTDLVRPGARWTSVETERLFAGAPCQRRAGADTLDALTELWQVIPGGSFGVLQLGAPATRAGTQTIDGVPTTHWRATVKRPSVVPRCTSIAPGTVDIYADRQDRARRIVYTIRGSTRRRATFQSLVLVLDLSDFGVGVHVTAPDRATVEDITTAQRAFLRGEGNVKGHWSRLRSGNTGGVRWTVWWANTTTDWRCYDLETTPYHRPRPPYARFVQRFAQADVPKHGGRAARCLPPGRGSFLGRVQVLWFEDTHTRFPGQLAVLSAARGYTSVALRFSRGQEQRITVDPLAQAFAWVGPREPALRSFASDGPDGHADCPFHPVGATVIADGSTYKPGCWLTWGD